MIRLSEILDIVSSYNKKADLDEIKKAYVFSAKVHQGQTRRSGEPYLIHPLEVAAILARMQLDVPSIVTALLHDTVEDTVATLEEVEQLFGTEVKLLVDGVTKLSKIHFSSREEEQAENFRKMIMAMSQDIRVILVKLADRLHNMRTLEYMSERSRIATARETRDIYAPIANRLGIQEMKIELEDLSFKHLKPTIYQKIDEGCQKRKATREKYIKEIHKIVEEEMKSHNVEFKFYGRLKHYYSVWRKMQAQNIPFDEVHDIVAFRLIVDDIPKCYEALGIIHALWRPVPGRFKDYIAMSKANNYQSLHTTVIGLHGERIEFQIRTHEMHVIAEHGIAAHWKYKDGGQIEDKDELKFKWLRRLLEWQKELSDPAEFMDTIKLDLFADDVYVFTPKGLLKELPRGSTPLDFAYSIHTDVGNTCVGAKVNGKIVPLRYQLRSGDTVEVITQKHGTPHKDWMSFVKTSRAKTKIRQHLRKLEVDQSATVGKELLEKSLSKFKMTYKEIAKNEIFRDFVKKSGYHSEEGVFTAIAYGKLSTKKIIGLLGFDEEEIKEKKESVLQRIVSKFRRPKGLVRVGGLTDVQISFAKCCQPIPGDAIVGFVTRGKGVTVHRFDCARVIGMDPARKIDVEWDVDEGRVTTATLIVVTVNKSGQLALMSEAISDAEGNITSAEVHANDDGTANGKFEVEVKDVSHLRKITHALESLKGIISVRRQTHG
ncbi:MAG: bifunctional (p)ppGpp synthetase/guanosine-3',5'-bis(diphosphate) 3'-pyrophosphohydrolase [Pseudomonadota bacterium]